MDDAYEPTFSGQEAAAAQTALREALFLEPEQFPLSAFIEMISDEIELLRARGQNDVIVASLVSDITGNMITAEQIERYYASPEERGHRGSA